MNLREKLESLKLEEPLVYNKILAPLLVEALHGCELGNALVATKQAIRLDPEEAMRCVINILKWYEGIVKLAQKQIPQTTWFVPAVVD